LIGLIRWPHEQGTMRPDVSWMTRADDRILEFYNETSISAPPTVVAYNIDMSETHIKRRISTLRDHGLLTKVNQEKGYYRIAQLGEQYLSGEAERAELE